ncbi:HEAT repeat domain-containing protein [Myxococcus vastator]|uniref:HEAT repeat domain-containing protein n=1 Tax=Myxococcus vastator TaxID=2709664 RepID=UPI0013D6B947|nr:HEAT repeat domain-containing protein [Myxococcus vastator]
MKRLCLLLTLPLFPLLATGAHAASADAQPALRASTCSVRGLMDDLRRGLGSGSPSYQRYLRTLLREAAVTLPDAELRDAFARETDPVMAEHLAAALVARAEREADPQAMDVVAQRALQDVDPAVRAATLRAMRRTGALERTGDLYERMVRDESPQVRQEAATNLIEDNAHVYAGQYGPAADTAVTAAVASSDPEVTARILDNLSTEKISAESAERITSLLRSDDASVRKAAVNALGGVPAEQMQGARESLLAMYREEPDEGVRKALLQSVAQLGFDGAIADLQRLRDMDPRLAREADAWIQVLGMGLQEWSLLLREKQRLQQAP